MHCEKHFDEFAAEAQLEQLMTVERLTLRKSLPEHVQSEPTPVAERTTGSPGVTAYKVLV